MAIKGNRDNVIAAVERILDNYLEMNHHRKTSERYKILRTIYGINGHFTIEELNDYLQESNFPVSRATLYNTLNLFLELRLVTRHRFQGTTKYEACYDTAYDSRKVKDIELEAPPLVLQRRSHHPVEIQRKGKEYHVEFGRHQHK